MESTPRSDTGCLGGTTGVDPVERVLGGSTAAGPVAVVAAFQSWLRDLDTSMLPDPVRVDLLTALERVKGSTAAAQARLTVDFADSQTRSFERDAAEIAADPSRQAEALGSGLLSSRGRARAASRSVGSQVGLARRCSPAVADRLVAAARQLVGQLPHTLAALTEGAIGEWQAQVIVAETAGLAPHSRAIADQRLAGLAPVLSGRGTARAARRIVAELAPAVVIARMEAAVAGRRVTVRPAPDGMAYLSVLAPLPEVVGAYGSLYRHATSVLAGTCPGETPQGVPRNGSDAAEPSGTPQSTPRGRGAIMADALLRWASGRTPGQAQPIEVHVVMTDRALLGTGDPTRSVEEPALVPGYGPVPAAVARAWLLAGVSPTGPSRTGRRRRPRPAVPTTQPSGETRPLRTQEPAGADEPGQAPDPAETQQARVFLRRLYTTPDGRDLVAVDSRRRVFTGGLRQFLVLRDQSCRTPFCDAPITAGEHVHPHADGGRTDATNGMGGCVRCNLVKQAPGWGCAVVTGAQSSAPHPGTTRHTVILTTPTGHEHLSTAPPVLGWGWAPADVRSPLERRLTELLGAA